MEPINAYKYVSQDSTGTTKIPIGSVLQLADGRKARVTRSNGFVIALEHPETARIEPTIDLRYAGQRGVLILSMPDEMPAPVASAEAQEEIASLRTAINAIGEVYHAKGTALYLDATLGKAMAALDRRLGRAIFDNAPTELADDDPFTASPTPAEQDAARAKVVAMMTEPPASVQPTGVKLTAHQADILNVAIDCDSVNNANTLRLQDLNKLAALGLLEAFNVEGDPFGKREIVHFTITELGKQALAQHDAKKGGR